MDIQVEMDEKPSVDYLFCSNENNDICFMNKRIKLSKYLTCYCCNYETIRQNDMKKHLSTKNHHKRMKIKEECSKTFIEDNTKKEVNSLQHPIIDTNFIMTLFKENTQVMCETIMKQLPLLTPSMVNSQNVSNVNSHNKQFNLNVYLNETCKNAMNMSEFIDSLVIKSEELEDMGKLGYVQGISNILVRGLTEMDEVDRPMHCTDKKRETLYIKENNVWEKEKDVKGCMKKIIQQISHKNFKHIAQWKLENPTSEDNSSQKHIQYMKILLEVMTSISPDEMKIETDCHKVMRNVFQHIMVSR